MDLFFPKWTGNRSRALYLIVYVRSIGRSSIASDVEGQQEEKLICKPFSLSVYFKKTSDVAASRCHALKKFRNSKCFSILKTKNATRLETYTKIYKSFSIRCRQKLRSQRRFDFTN